MPAKRAVAIIALAIALGLPLQAGAQEEWCPEGDPDSLYDGYSWNGICVPGLVSVRTWFTPAPTHAVGAAVFYAPNLMEAQAPYRGLSLDGFMDGVSLMSPADIGRTVWLKRPGFGWEGPFLVVDSAQRNHFYPIIVGRTEVVEVGFQTAVRWGMARETATGWRTLRWRIEDVEVWKGERPSDLDAIEAVRLDVRPTRMVDWFFDHLEFANGIDSAFGEFTPVFRRNPVRWLWTDRTTVLYPRDDWMTFLWNEGYAEFCRGFQHQSFATVCRPEAQFD